MCTHRVPGRSGGEPVDLAGQVWGINPDLGGMMFFSAMADRDPDSLLCSGDPVHPMARAPRP